LIVGALFGLLAGDALRLGDLNPVHRRTGR
jgi:hypothetical protein